MSRTVLLMLLLALSFLLAVGHHFAYEFFWYWRFWWFDILMHLGGGAFVALAANLAGTRRITTLVILALAVGLVWEGFEFLIGVTYYPSMVTDTALDLLDDVLGAVAIYAIIEWWNSQSLLPVAPDASPDQIS
jgi:hypothetical protein